MPSDALSLATLLCAACLRPGLACLVCPCGHCSCAWLRLPRIFEHTVDLAALPRIFEHTVDLAGLFDHVFGCPGLATDGNTYSR